MRIDEYRLATDWNSKYLNIHLLMTSPLLTSLQMHPNYWKDTQECLMLDTPPPPLQLQR